MRLTPIFKATCQSGKLVFDDREALSRYILNLKDGPVEVIIRRARAQRSLSQNSYYWGVVIPLLAEYCGYDEPDEMHDALKQRFLSAPIEHGLTRIRSTSHLTTTEFTDYIEKCRKLAAELGVYIPDPGEAA